ncbi:hypothetical protein EJ110_NYTH03280 [Nymphaea thermarum]|nr:hypothetical protein EJ110_NYTH03280 [Nymphaea thermarum]
MDVHCTVTAIGANFMVGFLAQLVLDISDHYLGAMAMEQLGYCEPRSKGVDHFRDGKASMRLDCRLAPEENPGFTSTAEVNFDDDPDFHSCARGVHQVEYKRDIIGVNTAYGDMQLTLIPNCPRSTAMLLHKPAIACFDAQYAGRPRPPKREHTLAGLVNLRHVWARRTDVAGVVVHDIELPVLGNSAINGTGYVFFTGDITMDVHRTVTAIGANFMVGFLAQLVLDISDHYLGAMAMEQLGCS